MADFPVKRMIPSSLTIILVIFFTAVIAGGGVYFWREQEINDLKQELPNTSQQEEVVVIDENEDQESIDTTENPIEENYPVVFVPGGRFTEKERNTLTEKLVKPIFDYYQDIIHTSSPTDVISITIEKEADSNYYLVSVVTEDKSAKTFGNMGFLFGSTREGYKYWTPECFGIECEFSDEFKSKHPEVVETYEDCPNCSLEVDL